MGLFSLDRKFTIQQRMEELRKAIKRKTAWWDNSEREQELRRLEDEYEKYKD